MRSAGRSTLIHIQLNPDPRNSVYRQYRKTAFDLEGREDPAGLASYPAAALGALLVGLLESFGSFWASSFKEVIVFTLIIPVLLWRSIKQPHHEEEE